MQMAERTSDTEKMQAAIDLLCEQNTAVKAALDPRLCATSADNLSMELGSKPAGGAKHTLCLSAPEHTTKAYLVLNTKPQAANEPKGEPEKSVATAARLTELGFSAEEILTAFRDKCGRYAETLREQADTLEAAVQRSNTLLAH